MRRLRYQVAASLDGYIAGPHGEADWIPDDPEADTDLEVFSSEFDSALMGRRTYEHMVRQGHGQLPGFDMFVCSQTLRPGDYPNITIIADSLPETVASLKSGQGKDIWLFGGGQLFGKLLELGLVDTVEVAVIPVLLGGGIPLLPAPAARTQLKLTSHKVYSSGIVLLEYTVLR